MKIVIASDHGGYALKEDIKSSSLLLSKDIEFIDLGTDNGKISVDYPDYAAKLSNYVLTNSIKGVLVCGTGIGMSIAANKIKGIRAALCHDEHTAQMAARHNNANIIVLGGRILNFKVAENIVLSWLESNFEKGRHLNRIDKITKLEK